VKAGEGEGRKHRCLGGSQSFWVSEPVFQMTRSLATSVMVDGLAHLFYEDQVGLFSPHSGTNVAVGEVHRSRLNVFEHR
jgi:hypothetical protein